ncbi:MAG: DUF6117 family protein [Nitrospirota bacterium]
MNRENMVAQHRMNFEALSHAFEAGDVCLLDCRIKATGERVAAICAVGVDGEAYTMTPFAIMLNDEPFEILDPPTIGEDP